VGVCRLDLVWLKTIQTNHHMFALPQRRFVKLIGPRSFKVTPIQEM
jgi:hypothetical protein